MSVVFTQWTTSGENHLDPKYEVCSPNLVELRGLFEFLYGRNPLGAEHGYLGCHNNRNISGSERLSVHSWGAAMDYRIPAKERKNILDFLIWSAPRTGVQMINDYENDRIWKNTREDFETYDGDPGTDTDLEGWKPYNLPANNHFHIEVNKPFFSVKPNWGALFVEYVNPSPPKPPPAPKPIETLIKYEVISGDNYWAIAKKLYREGEDMAVIVEELQRYNAYRNPLYVGDKLNVPGRVVLS